MDIFKNHSIPLHDFVVLLGIIVEKNFAVVFGMKFRHRLIEHIDWFTCQVRTTLPLDLALVDLGIRNAKCDCKEALTTCVRTL